ncbi:hypothetical protein [Halobaculum magnesiiphilum]|uniref:Uncharacterized protein n=1 Tax=Halobaculum magnesiiphilum TaxID=1017351 RepID=A0A8T8WFW2_9EURY|nr:hypothetical protein [Halobaculum magnesiiphilum]QZP38676.1 hypothetical protein K6T50_05930 [Halobaculum magnesiiphilum]
MRRPTHGGRGVPETDVSVGPTAAAAALALATFLAYAFPPVATAAVGAAVALAGRRLVRAIRARAAGDRRRRRLCLPGTRACVEV